MRKAAPGVAKHETSLLHPAFVRTAACDEEKSGTRRSASDDESTDGIAGIVLIHTDWCDLSSPKESEVLATCCSNEKHVEAAGRIKEAGSKSQMCDRPNRRNRQTR